MLIKQKSIRVSGQRSKRCIAKCQEKVKSIMRGLQDADSSIHTNCNSSQATVRGACLMQLRGERIAEGKREREFD